MPVIWELDFYSRPLVDDQNKKLWEVLICESPLAIDSPVESLFRYSEFCSNTEVNSVRLRQAVEQAIAQAPKRPDRIRFFRRQMTNMITKACEDAGIPAYASRRTLVLHQWLQQRMADLYPTYPNYQAGANPSVDLGNPVVNPLPDALRGQQWRFVTLEASAFDDFAEWDVGFGEAFPLELANLSPTTLIPGLIIYSPRALPLAAWVSGLEVAFLTYDRTPPSKLILATGANDNWLLANLSTPALQKEAEDFEAAKAQANQVHFVAIQSDPNAESFTGFWMLQELALS